MVFGLGKKKSDKGQKVNAPIRAKKKGGLFSPLSKYFFNIISKYSASQEEVVGIEVTPTAVKVAQLREDNDRWTLTKFSYRNVDNGSEELLRTNPEIYVEQIQTALQIAKVDTTNAAIALPVSSAIIRVLQMPIMTDEEIENAIATDSLWENLTQLPDAVEEYSIFHQTIRKDSATNLMDVLFVASKLPDVNQYIEIVKKAKLNPIVMDVRCFALRNAFETKDMKELRKVPIAILEMGTHENYLLILKEEIPFVSDIFVSTKDKATLGSDQKDEKELAPIIDRFAMQIKQNLDSYSSRFKSEKVSNLFLVSNSANIELISAKLSEKFKDIAVILLDPFNNMIVPEQVKEKLNAESNTSSFTTVTGLATRKLDIFGYYQKVTGVNNINLLPNREGVRKTQRTKFLSGFILVALIAILIIASIWIGVSFFQKNSENTEELHNYSQIENDLDQLQLQMMKLKNENINLIESLKLSETATTNQKTAAQVLIDLAEQAGINIALAKIDFDGDVNYTIEGDALSDSDVIQYLSKIRAIEIFESVVLEKSFMSENGGNVKSFIIQIKVKKEEMNRKNLEEEEEEDLGEEIVE